MVPRSARGYLANQRPRRTASPTDGSAQVIWAWWTRTGTCSHRAHQDIINRGGEKICPEHVEAILAECSGVTEAACSAIPDATYGERAVPPWS